MTVRKEGKFLIHNITEHIHVASCAGMFVSVAVCLSDSAVSFIYSALVTRPRLYNPN